MRPSTSQNQVKGFTPARPLTGSQETGQHRRALTTVGSGRSPSLPPMFVTFWHHQVGIFHREQA